MAFKLTFSFLKYLVSPDAMTDKEQGVGKLIGRVVAMIIMLIAFPIVFFNPVPGDSQNRTVLAILQDGVVKTLPRIILGQAIGDTNASGSVNAKDNGKELALSMLKSFYYPSVCNEDSKNYDKNQSAECQKYFAGEQASINSKDDLDPSGINSFKAFNNSIINEGSGGDYAYQYMWPLTTVTGILLIVIMAGICIDIAIRCFKLLILEVMAPVPIMTYIDPKASKDGSFAAWSKTLISTYIDLFVKLGTVYLVLLLASALFKQELFDKAAYNNFSGLSYLYVQVFLVIGLFQFAKQAPKFIKDALGIKDNGGGGGFMGKALAGMAGAAAGFAGGVASGGGIMGGLSAAAGGFSAGAANAGSGKPLGLYGKTRDEMAKSLGKTPGGVKGKMQLAANKRALAKMGVSEGTLDDAKTKMLADEAKATAGETALEQAIHNRDDSGATWWIDANGHRQTASNADAAIVSLTNAAQNARSQAVKSKKRFEKMDEAYKPFKKGFYDEHHRGLVDNVKGKAETAYNAVRHPIQNIKDVAASAKQAVGDIAKDTFSIRNDSDKRYNERRNDQRAENFKGKNRDQI